MKTSRCKPLFKHYGSYSTAIAPGLGLSVCWHGNHIRTFHGQFVQVQAELLWRRDLVIVGEWVQSEASHDMIP